MFYPLVSEDELKEGLFEKKEVEGISLLVIFRHSKIYIIENKCGHFGMPLHKGHFEEDTIVCSYHGISFNLSDGEIANRPYENCASVNTFEVVSKEGFIGVEFSGTGK